MLSLKCGLFSIIHWMVFGGWNSTTERKFYFSFLSLPPFSSLRGLWSLCRNFTPSPCHKPAIYAKIRGNLTPVDSQTCYINKLWKRIPSNLTPLGVVFIHSVDFTVKFLQQCLRHPGAFAHKHICQFFSPPLRGRSLESPNLSPIQLMYIRVSKLSIEKEKQNTRDNLWHQFLERTKELSNFIIKYLWSFGSL